MQVPPFSFLQFGDFAPGYHEVLPFQNVGDLSFQVLSGEVIGGVGIVSPDGELLDTSDAVIERSGDELYSITPVFSSFPSCFRIALLSEDDTVLEVSSVSFALTDSRYTSQVVYLNDEDGFDFSYCSTGFVNRVRLPLYLRSPQFPQTQTVYDKRNGRRKLLSASISKVWELETDYLSEAMHEKIIVALAHDEVYIDGRLLTKTEDYTIDYSSVLERGGVKYMKASSKVSANVTHRNSNCGESCPHPEAVFDVQPRIIVF
jgi:hypothetical protein